MSDYLSFITVFVSGLFALVVALVTTYLANANDRQKHSRDVKRKRYDDTESLYVDVLATLETAIRETQHLQTSEETTAAFPRLNARLLLTSTPDIINQYETAGSLLYQWSSEYKRGPNQRIGEIGITTVSSGTLAHADKAKELYPKLNAEVVKLAELMKDHLKNTSNMRQLTRATTE
jgi:hypothetical protein